MKSAMFVGWMIGLGLLGPASGAPDLEASYVALVAAQEASPGAPDREVARRIASIYAARFAPINSATLEGLATDDVDVVFRAASIATGYTFDREQVQQMKRAYDVLAERGALGERYAQSMLESLVFARMLDEARQFADATPALGVTLPAFEAGPAMLGKPTVWAVEDQGNTLTQRNVDLSSTMIVVVSHPLCRFSQAAATEIARSDDLRARFGPPSIWLVPQTTLFDTQQVQAWELDHAPFRMVYANTQREWPMLDRWSTPAFYFFKDGEVVHKVVGWPAEGRRAELLEGLSKLDGRRFP